MAAGAGAAAMATARTGAPGAAGAGVTAAGGTGAITTVGRVLTASGTTMARVGALGRAATAARGPRPPLAGAGPRAGGDGLGSDASPRPTTSKAAAARAGTRQRRRLAARTLSTRTELTVV
jgi:hypothetical protein